MEGTVKTWEIPAGAPFIRTHYALLPAGFRWMRGVLPLVRRRDFDTIIFHANPFLLNTWPAAILARLTGKRVLFFTIGWYRPESALRRWIKRRYFQLAHGLLLYGHWAKACGIENGFDPDRLHVVYNSLDAERQREIRESITPDDRRITRAEFFSDPNRPMVICTSRLTAKRRLDLLLDAMEILASQGHPLNLLLIGDGDQRAALEDDARRRNLAVHFFGACYDEPTLGRMIASASVTAAPGMVGLTAMHSLAYGTPVVTHGDPNHQSPEWEVLIPGRNGGLFRRNDAEDLARVLREWTTSEFPSDATRAHCVEMIERFYNATYQRRCFDRAVSGLPANDLLGSTES